MKKNILLVEDNSDHHFILKAHLESEKYRVISANNGMKALKLLEKEKIDLMILDLWLPQMDGFGFLKNLKENLSWASIPVIITTGVERPREILALAGFQVENCFTKPYQPQDVVAAVERLLAPAQKAL